jgi:hypothetical protein
MSVGLHKGGVDIEVTMRSGGICCLRFLEKATYRDFIQAVDQASTRMLPVRGQDGNWLHLRPCDVEVVSRPPDANQP